MNTSNFEKKYMEDSWSNDKNKVYNNDQIDDSIIKFNNFLQSKKIKGKLLDLGCGNGKNTNFFQIQGFNSLGVDFSKSAIDICKKIAKDKNVNSEFVVGDILNFSSNERFDVIIDCGCLHHIRKSSWNNYRKTIIKNISDNGYYYIHGIADSLENKQLPKHPKNRNWIINKKGHYTHFISLEEIEKLFGKDFKIVKSYKFKSRNSPLTIIAIYLVKI